MEHNGMSSKEREHKGTQGRNTEELNKRTQRSSKESTPRNSEERTQSGAQRKNQPPTASRRSPIQ